MAEHDCVREAFGRKALGTQEQYCGKLMEFFEEMGVSPEEFLRLDKFEARDLAWDFAKPFIRDSPSKARNRLAALKAFYRSKDGERLPFDSCRGGKHYFQTKRRKKAAKEHVPDKTEMYQIIDATNNIRDKAIFLLLFQSGIRNGVIENLRFKHVKDQLYREGGPKIPLRIRITDQMDTKLQGYSISFYDTFLQGEAVQALKAYCDKYHKDGDPDQPLFFTKIGTVMDGQAIWQVLKTCVKRAGKDPETIWVQTIRKAFKREVRYAPVDDEDLKEAIMGHVLPGSRENYFSRERPEDIEEQYMKINFGREVPETRLQIQSKQITDLRRELREKSEQLETLASQAISKEDIETLTQLLRMIKEGKIKVSL